MECNAKPNSSLDTIILQRENKEKSRKMQSKGKRKRPPKRQHTGSTRARTAMTTTEKKFTTQNNRKCSDKHISQQIHVEKQEFQCIINLNTTICEHKSKHRNCDRKHQSMHTHRKGTNKSKHSRSSHTIRDKHSMVPKCLRRDCVNSTFNKKRRRQEVFGRSYVERKDKNKKTINRDNPKKSKQVNSDSKSDYNKDKKNDPRILMSPISSAPLDDDSVGNLTYEDVSSCSLQTQSEKPMSCKRRKHRKPRKEVSQESKLDTLIRRTKERERRFVEQFRIRSIQPWYTSTPIRNELSSGDFPMSGSDMDISFNSRSTFVLETRSLPYSPSCPTEDMTEFSYCCYSPSSPTNSKDYLLNDLNVVANDDYKPTNIKNEPPMNIEAYSPTCSPDKLQPKIRVRTKKEVEPKTEPPFSAGISPIHFEDNNNGLEFCKIDSIKSETDQSINQ